MRGIVVAVSQNGVIGLHGTLPWHYPADAKRFKRLTMGGTLIMGRATWESLPKKPLPGRRNIVITERTLPGVETFPSIPAALATCEGAVWFAGGARIYAEAMQHAELIDMVIVPERIDDPAAVRFPEIDASQWQAGPVETLADDPRLQHRVYRRTAQ